MLNRNGIPEATVQTLLLLLTKFFAKHAQQKECCEREVKCICEGHLRDVSTMQEHFLQKEKSGMEEMKERGKN